MMKLVWIFTETGYFEKSC